MTNELTQYLKDQFKVQLDNKVKFDQNNNLLVDVSYSGGKITLHIPMCKIITCIIYILYKEGNVFN